MELLVRAALNAPSSMSTILLQHGGGVGRQPSEVSSFGTRKWEYSVVFMAFWAVSGLHRTYSSSTGPTSPGPCATHV